MADQPHQNRVHPVPEPMLASAVTSSAPVKPLLPVTQRPVPEPIPASAAASSAPVKPLLPLVQRPVLLPPKKSNLWCKCLCWVLSLVVIALVALAITAAVIYFVFHPKLPSYEVNSLRVTSLGINLDLTLSAEFNIQITARNPNNKIGIYYEKGGRVGVWYTKTKLCEGPIPKFYQGHQNVTKLSMDLTGRAQYGNAVMSALQQQQQTGRVPLDLKVEAPVALKLGKLKLKKIRILGNCKLVVDSLSTNNRINIKASDCSFRLKL